MLYIISEIDGCPSAFQSAINHCSYIYSLPVNGRIYEEHLKNLTSTMKVAYPCRTSKRYLRMPTWHWMRMRCSMLWVISTRTWLEKYLTHTFSMRRFLQNGELETQWENLHTSECRWCLIFVFVRDQSWNFELLPNQCFNKNLMFKSNYEKWRRKITEAKNIPRTYIICI